MKNTTRFTKVVSKIGFTKSNTLPFFGCHSLLWLNSCPSLETVLMIVVPLYLLPAGRICWELVFSVHHQNKLLGSLNCQSRNRPLLTSSSGPSPRMWEQVWRRVLQTARESCSEVIWGLLSQLHKTKQGKRGGGGRLVLKQPEERCLGGPCKRRKVQSRECSAVYTKENWVRWRDQRHWLPHLFSILKTLVLRH